MAWLALVVYFHITIFLIVLEVGHATKKDARVQGATAQGDILIAGIISVHEDVDKENTSFAPHLQPCIR